METFKPLLGVQSSDIFVLLCYKLSLINLSYIKLCNFCKNTMECSGLIQIDEEKKLALIMFALGFFQLLDNILVQ